MVESLGYRGTTNEQRASVRQRCAPFFPFKGVVDLSNKARVTLSVILDFDPRRGEPAPPRVSGSTDGELYGLPVDRLRHVFIGTSHATRRSLHIELALPRRAYLGPTSLEPLLALTMCNMAAVQPGALVMDPFVGTGSILVAGTSLT